MNFYNFITSLTIKSFISASLLRNFSITKYLTGFFVCLFRATPAAYGGSQARGQIGTVATGYDTATAMQDPSHVFDLHYSSRQRRILNLPSKARDRTCVLMDASRVLNLLSPDRTV